VLFEHGMTSDFVYVVEEGEVVLVRERSDRSEETLRAAGPGEYFGELGPLLRRPRSATARALTNAVVTGYNPQSFKQAVKLN
jgi:putative ABC transport system ATP-binding protein